MHLLVLVLNSSNTVSLLTPQTFNGTLVVCPSGVPHSLPTHGSTLHMRSTYVDGHPIYEHCVIESDILCTQFSAQTVGLWYSTGGNRLTKVVQNIGVSTSTNSADFHVGVLRIVNRNPPEDWYWSGVYIESGSINTAIGNGSGGGGSTTVPTTTPTTPPTTTRPTTTVPSTTTTSGGPQQTQWGQCGGTGYNGPTVCVSPYTCKAVSPPYYYQVRCLLYDSLLEISNLFCLCSANKRTTVADCQSGLEMLFLVVYYIVAEHWLQSISVSRRS